MAAPTHSEPTPPISMASVTIRPSKPSSPRSRSTASGGDRVAGAPDGSIAGTATCASMTESTPASTARRKGGSSTASSRSRSTSIVGSETWLSIAVSPWPGKCLAVDSMPPPRRPSMKAAPRRETSSGSSPKERRLITGLAGLLLTSTTGAKAQWMPTARPSRAVTSPRKRAASAERVAPIAMA